MGRSDRAHGRGQRRPGLDEVRDLARRGRVDVVVVWRLDRLARSLRNFIDLAEELQASGVTLVSLREGLDLSTGVGRTFAHLIAVIAEMERELIRERVVAGVAAARHRGKRIGRRPRHVDLDVATELRAAGLSYREVSARMGLSASIIHRALTSSPTAVGSDPDGVPKGCLP